MMNNQHKRKLKLSFYKSIVNPNSKFLEILDYIGPEGESQDSEFGNSCHFLNKSIDKLRSGEIKGTEKDDVMIESTVGFVEKVASDPKYCNVNLVRAFGELCVSQALDGLGTLFNDGDSRRIYQELVLKFCAEPISDEDIDLLYLHARPSETTYFSIDDHDIYTHIQLCYITLHYYFSMGKTIKRCENCGRFFIPKRPADAYCTHKQQNGSLSCAEEARQRGENADNGDERQRLYKKIHSRIGQANYREHGTRNCALLDEFVDGYMSISETGEESEIMAYLKDWDNKTIKKRRRDA